MNQETETEEVKSVGEYLDTAHKHLIAAVSARNPNDYGRVISSILYELDDFLMSHGTPSIKKSLKKIKETGEHDLAFKKGIIKSWKTKTKLLEQIETMKVELRVKNERIKALRKKAEKGLFGRPEVTSETL